MSQARKSAFELRGLGVQFPGSERSVFEDIDLNVESGQFLSLVGPSGCGKSTLLKILASLLTPSSGTLHSTVSGDSHQNRIGFVFQHPTLLPWRTAEANLRLPLELGRKRSESSLTATECRELLLQVGLSLTDAPKRPGELSGGMQMRLSLARALATRPDVLLLDEPFAAVDDLLRLRLQEDVRRLHEERQLTSILVTHNLHEAVFLSDRVVVLSGTPARIQADIAVKASSNRADGFRDSPAFLASLKSVTNALFLDRDLAGTSIP